MDAITQLISSVGFPIVCCILLWYQSFKDQERHAKLYDDLKTAVDNNTEVITKLIERIDGDDKGN